MVTIRVFQGAPHVSQGPEEDDHGAQAPEEGEDVHWPERSPHLQEVCRQLDVEGPCQGHGHHPHEDYPVGEVFGHGERCPVFSVHLDLGRPVIGAEDLAEPTVHLHRQARGGRLRVPQLILAGRQQPLPRYEAALAWGGTAPELDLTRLQRQLAQVRALAGRAEDRRQPFGAAGNAAEVFERGAPVVAQLRADCREKHLCEQGHRPR
mmetsp:Transcript_109653/g.354004  ORF Transcript_109653/g.354004 Transcript_109653/m.354004 type:complete len:207 (+) Transcript_109653:179-799(+)